MDSECPCCAEPWSMRFPPGTPTVYAAYLSSDVIAYNARTGASLGIFYTPTGFGTVRAMCVDNAGNVYIGDGTLIVAMSESGATLWTANHGVQIYALAVSNDGWVYSGGQASSFLTNTDLRKWNATTGTENTTGWPYSWGYTDFPPQNGWLVDYPYRRGYITGICVDRSGNVYACGTMDASGDCVVSLDSAGAVRWSAEMPVSNTPYFPNYYYGGSYVNAMIPTGIAINQGPGTAGTGSYLYVSNTFGYNIYNVPPSAAAGDGHYWIFQPWDGQGGLAGFDGVKYCAAVSPTSQYFGGAQYGGLNYAIIRNLGYYYQPGGTGSVVSMCTGMDNSVFIGLNEFSGATNLRSIGLNPWTATDGFGNPVYAVCHSQGLVGAFGVR